MRTQAGAWVSVPRVPNRQRRPSGRVLLTPLLLALSLVAAGCLPDVDPRAGADARPPVQVDTSLGVVRIPPGTSIDVRIVLDGPEDEEGLAAVLEAAIRTAVEDFGVVQQGFRVDLGELILTDCTREDGARVGAELAASDSLVAILGPQCSATLLGLQAPLDSAGMVVVTPRPTELTLTVGADGLPAQDRAGGTWRTAPSALQLARAAAEHAHDDLGRVRAAVLHDGSLESVGAAAAFRARFQELGGTVVVERRVEDDVTAEDGDIAGPALDAVLDAVVSATIDVAFLPLAPDVLLAVADGWSGRSGLVRAARLTMSSAAVPAFLSDEASQGHLVAAPVLEISEMTSAVTGMSASQTRERVAGLSGVRDPSGWWAYAYDATTLLLKALEDTSLIDNDGSLVLSRAELRANLARITFVGFTGPIACAPLGDCAARRTAIHAHDDASVVELSAVPVVARIEE